MLGRGVAGARGDGSVMLVWTQLVFLPSPEGVSKGQGRWRLCDSPERKIPIKAIRPQGRPFLAAVWFSPRDNDISSHRVPNTGIGTACWRMDIYVGYRKGSEPKGWIDGSVRVKNPQSTHLDTFPGMPVPQPEPVSKPSKLLK